MAGRISPSGWVTSPTWGPNLHVNRPYVTKINSNRKSTLQRASKFHSSETRPTPLKLFHGSRPCLTRPNWCGSYCFGRTWTGTNTIHLSIMFLWVIYRFPRFLSICYIRGDYLFYHSVLEFVYVSAFRRKILYFCFFFFTSEAALSAIFQTKRLVSIRIKATDYFLQFLRSR